MLRKVVIRLRARLLGMRAGMTCDPSASIAARVKIDVSGGTVEVAANVSIGSGTVIRAFNGGTLILGPGTQIYEDCTLEAQGGRLVVGERCHISRGCVLSAGQHLRIGDGCQLGEYVSIRDHDHVLGVAPSSYEYDHAPVEIEPDVWLAAKVTVTRGLTIGAGAVAGAHSVVTSDVPERTLVVGAPARPVRVL